jgi:hypothetical protein
MFARYRKKGVNTFSKYFTAKSSRWERRDAKAAETDFGTIGNEKNRLV